MSAPALGIRANLPQFALLVLVNGLVGGMVGLERTLVPGLAEDVFGLQAAAAMLGFIAVFGTAKALTNLIAGGLSDRIGRKPVLVAGWLLALPVPFALIAAPSWGWILAANALLGISQGLTWSTTVIMKIDLAGPRQRGLAMGLNESAGYLAVSVTALATGLIAAEYGLRPQPFYLGIGLALLGTGLSLFAVRETRDHAAVEQGSAPDSPLGTGEVVWRTSVSEPSLSSASVVGFANNLNDGMAWGLFPLLFASAGLGYGEIGVLVAIYPAVWGVGQLVTGAASDRYGRKPLIVAGMLLQGVAILGLALATTPVGFGVGTFVLGAGTAMVYPALLAVIGDVAAPSWRATAVGVYRLWRDLGYVGGALLAGVVADAFGLRAAVVAVAGITLAAALLAAVRMRDETPAAVPA